MKRFSIKLCFCLCMSLFATDKTINFNRDIRPVLSDKCFHCHGPDEEDRKEDLRLDISGGEQGALSPRDGYKIIAAGDLEKSELWYRIVTDDEDDIMPPKKSSKKHLTEKEIALFKQWILEGGEYEDFWAFVPPVKTKPAEVKDKHWGKGMIDNRVMAMLETGGLEPKEEADKRTLIRRVTFSLTGLPPTLEEIDAFLKDGRTNAYGKLVDDLLARDSYGEHMTRYWADLVRLGDTNGMHKDRKRTFSTYRDWLIRSFNENMPYDDFIEYQLAGDLYKNPSRDQLVASGFNRLHLIIDKGTALPEESLHKNVLDRVEAFGTAFLGLTVQCAQCHDHKYDPITQKDYYQLYAFFNNFSGAAETGRNKEHIDRGLQEPFINLPTPAEEKKLSVLNAEMKNLEQEVKNSLTAKGLPRKFDTVKDLWIWNGSKDKLDSIEFKSEFMLGEPVDSAIIRFTGRGYTQLSLNTDLLGSTEVWNEGIALEVGHLLKQGENVISVKSKTDAGFAFILDYKIGGKKSRITSKDGSLFRLKPEEEWKPVVKIDLEKKYASWSKVVSHPITSKINKVKESIEKMTRGMSAAMVMREREPMRESTIFIRGSYEHPGKPVERNTPVFLPPMKPKKGVYSRMDLAEWLTQPNHPLTARVAVNRLWQQMLGTGLVKTAEDFGAQGEWPTHPQLLDDLALNFIESGWDMKSIMKEIALSKAYRQSSDADAEEFKQDPENRKLSRGSRYRMDAEMIRDQILSVSGQLNRTMYGRAVKPPQPPGLWEMVSMEFRNKVYHVDKGDDIYRRSLYTFWRRGMPPPAMTIMNAPSREFCLARRERTNTPLQALLMMNEEEYFKAAKKCAKITLAKTKESKEGLIYTYEKITSHKPDPIRLQLMEDTLMEFKDLYKNDKALTGLLTPELSGSDFDKRVELAAWTMMAHSILNLDLAKVRR